MQAARRDADFGTKAEFAAIGKLGGGIVQHDGRIDTGQEPFGHGGSFGHDRIGVLAAVGGDMGDGAIDAGDFGNAGDGVEILGVPILRGGRQDAGIERLHRCIAAHFARPLQQRRHQSLLQRSGRRSIDQQRLHRSAHRRAAQLAVDHDRHGLFGIGAGIDIDMVDAIQMRQHRHPRLLLHARHQPLAAARDDHVDQAMRSQHLADQRAVTRRHHLDGGGRQPGFAQPMRHAIEQHRVRLRCFRTPAQQAGIAGHQAQGSGIGRHARPAFIDDADDAQRHPHALELQAIGLAPARDHRAHRICKAGNRRDTAGNRRDTAGIQRQPIDQCRRHSGRFCRRHIGGIGAEQLFTAGPDRIGRRANRQRLLRGRRCGQRRQGQPRRAGHVGNQAHISTR